MEAADKKRLCVVTSTRADWGLLAPVCRALRERGLVDLQIVATNMHLIERYGYTLSEIEDDGFLPSALVPTDVEGDGDMSRALVMARTTEGMARAFAQLRPDALLILGDRYEMLAVASTAAVMHIPIVHIAGGEVTVGALDDAFRHAITKLSTLHLTATEEYRRRVIQMGENPAMVKNAGAIGVWNAMHVPVMGADELSESIGFDVSSRPALITYHPATNDIVSPAERLATLLAALETFPNLCLVFTAPNNDAGGAELFDMIERYVAARANATLVPSLGMVRYHSMLRYASMVIGNSSSGIVEVPSAGIPTVDLGVRQQGRLAGPSVIHSEENVDAIRSAIAQALSPQMQQLAAKCVNPYYKADTLEIMLETINNFMAELPLSPKQFYDVP